MNLIYCFSELTALMYPTWSLFKFAVLASEATVANEPETAGVRDSGYRDCYSNSTTRNAAANTVTCRVNCLTSGARSSLHRAVKITVTVAVSVRDSRRHGRAA